MDWLRIHVTAFLLLCITKINRCKDQSLAYTLHELSLDYERRPMEQCKFYTKGE